ncbi:hypothetical protein V1511DRAFT_453405, partial [Dipodascopsis uninucleata]
AAVHLKKLQELDEDIAKLLGYAADSISVINRAAGDGDGAKQEFREHAQKLFAGLESVTVALRREAKALQDANILTLAVNTNTDFVLKQKEHDHVRVAQKILSTL